MENDTARAKVFYSLSAPNNIAPVDGQPAEPPIRTVERVEILNLKRETVPWIRENNEKWRIVAPNFEDLKSYDPLSLQHIAYFGSQRADTLSQLRAEISVSRLKETALGATQFVQDYDEQFRFENEFWREAIRPYVQNDALFLIPGTRDFYTFNDNLSDKSLAQVNAPAQTVLLYEGEDETPIFRYGGKAAVGFVDGHVALVSRDEAKTLIWKP